MSTSSVSNESNKSNESNGSTYEQCIEIINDKKKLNINEYNNKWIDFNNKYPKLFQMLTSNENIDLNMIKFLCDLAEKQKNGSEETKLENDFKVSDKLAKNYIYDKFPEPSEEHKNMIKESLKTKIKNGENISDSLFRKK